MHLDVHELGTRLLIHDVVEAASKLTLVRARGSLVWDDQGREYTDCTAQAWLNNLGATDPRVVYALLNVCGVKLATCVNDIGASTKAWPTRQNRSPFRADDLTAESTRRFRRTTRASGNRKSYGWRAPAPTLAR